MFDRTRCHVIAIPRSGTRRQLGFSDSDPKKRIFVVLDTAYSRVVKVTVCVVTHNNATCIDQTAASIRAACAGLESELIFVENASHDDTLARLDRISDSKIILLEENIGFAAGYNLAMQHASGEYMLLLNADAAPDPAAIERMAHALDADPELGAVGPRIVDESNHLLWSVVPEPAVLRGIGQSFIRHILPKTTRSFREWVRHRPHYEPRPVTMPVRMVDGVCIMLRRSALIDVGGFDEQFFFDYETVELGHRLAIAGYAVGQRQDAAVLHIAGGGHSRRSEADAVVWSTESGMRLYARQGKAKFVPYVIGTTLIVGFRAGFEQVMSLIAPSHRATSERYRSLLKSIWSLRSSSRNRESHTQIASLGTSFDN